MARSGTKRPWRVRLRGTNAWGEILSLLYRRCAGLATGRRGRRPRSGGTAPRRLLRRRRLLRGRRRWPAAQTQISEVVAADHVIPIGEAVVEFAGGALARAGVSAVRRGF